VRSAQWWTMAHHWVLSAEWRAARSVGVGVGVGAVVVPPLVVVVVVARGGGARPRVPEARGTRTASLNGSWLVRCQMSKAHTAHKLTAHSSQLVSQLPQLPQLPRSLTVSVESGVSLSLVSVSVAEWLWHSGTGVQVTLSFVLCVLLPRVLLHPLLLQSLHAGMSLQT
jgi:hypothetical protein